MGYPQGSANLNPHYFDDLIDQINRISLCAELQEVVNTVMADLQAEKNAIEAQIEALLPIAELLSLPTDLGSVISWIGNLVNSVIKPIYQPYLTYAEQLIAFATQIARLISAIEAAAARLESCSITIPVIT
jgi:hypothetical protein